MPEEGFLRRWARVKATGADVAPEPPPPAPPPAPAPASTASPWARAGDVPQPVPGPEDGAGAAAATEASAASTRPSPTLEDVAQLTPDSDYSIFVGKGVDKSVQRLALKKLFADPHFNVPDRLDMYMDDYNIPSPVSEAMLASLDHARSSLRRFVEDDPAAAPVQAGDILVAPTDPAAPAAPAEPELADPAAPQAAAPGASPHQAVPHNEAAHATAAHDDSLSGNTPPDTSSRAPALDHGPFHSPNQQLPQLHQGQA